MKDEESKPKVISLRLQRAKQQKAQGHKPTDPVVRLAEELTELLGKQQLREVQAGDTKGGFSFAVDQLLAIELGTQSLLRVLEHTYGPTTMNVILVEVERRRGQYRVEWPEHDKTKTYFDHMGEQEDAEIIHLIDPDDSA